MVGVCAGWREKVRLGDVIIAERLFRYDSGKLRAFCEDRVRMDEVFQDIRTYNLEPRWRQSAEDFHSDWTTTVRVISRPLGYMSQEVWLLYSLNDAESGSVPPPREMPERGAYCPDWTDVVTRLEKRGFITLQGGIRLTDAGRNYVCELRDRFPAGYPTERKHPKAFVAPMATGNRVMEDSEIFQTIHRYVRKALAIDMEGAAVAAVAEVEGVEHCLVVKGVQDHADSKKDDRFREYAIEVSIDSLQLFYLTNSGLQRGLLPSLFHSTKH
jgi:nucleoside phosphorylase